MRRLTNVLLAGSLTWVALVVPSPSSGQLPPRSAEDPTLLAQKEAPGGKEDQGRGTHKAPDVIYVPTPQEVVDQMLELAEVKQGDVLYDLGCGDGRIVVTAAKKYGVKAVGFDVDPKRIRESQENVRKNGVEDLVTIKQDDIFRQDLSQANVVTLYLLPSLNVRLMPQLAKLKPGSRIVSHSFDMKGAKPTKVEHVKTRLGGERTIYLWVVPWEKEER
jgi:SAM-dependent methyltransferase